MSTPCEMHSDIVETTLGIKDAAIALRVISLCSELRHIMTILAFLVAQPMRRGRSISSDSWPSYKQDG